MEIILNQLVYFGFFQSLLLLLIYAFSAKGRSHISGYMAFFIGLLTIGLAGKVLYNAGVWGYNFRLIALSELSALLFGPTIFLFTRSLLYRTRFSKQDLIHYLPSVVYSIFIAAYFVIPNNAILSARAETGQMMRAIYACHSVGLIVNIIYWIKAFSVYRSFSTDMQHQLSFEPQTRFLSNFLVVTAICFLIWTVVLLISFCGMEMLERNARPYIWLALTLIILFITYYVMASPKVLAIIPESNRNTKKYRQSKLTTADLGLMKEKLELLMQEKKPYLNSKLLKAELAEMMEMNGPDLARLLNENIGMNYYEYVNYYRIKEFVALAQTEKSKQLTFFGLAQEAGFHSKTTFNKSFKKLMGSSPTAYFNKN